MMRERGGQRGRGLSKGVEQCAAAAAAAVLSSAPQLNPPPQHTHKPSCTTNKQLPIPGGLIEDITLGGHSLLDAEHRDAHLAGKKFTLGEHPIRVAGMKVRWVVMLLIVWNEQCRRQRAGRRRPAGRLRARV